MDFMYLRDWSETGKAQLRRSDLVAEKAANHSKGLHRKVHRNHVSSIQNWIERSGCISDGGHWIYYEMNMPSSSCRLLWLLQYPAGLRPTSHTPLRACWKPLWPDLMSSIINNIEHLSLLKQRINMTRIGHLASFPCPSGDTPDQTDHYIWAPSCMYVENICNNYSRIIELITSASPEVPHLEL